MSFGARMQAALNLRGKTRADLCRMTGLTSGHLTPYIKDPKRSPKLSTACKIARALDVSLEYLGEMTDDPSSFRSQNAPPLDADERELVDAWRDSDARGRRAIMRTARDERGVEGQPPADVREAV